MMRLPGPLRQAARPGHLQATAGNCHFELRIFLEVVEKALSSLLALPGRPA